MSKFILTAAALEMLENAEYPDLSHIPMLSQEDLDDDIPVYHGRNVKWDLSTFSYVVEVPVENIAVTELNLWNYNHAAGLLEYIESGDAVLEPPFARFYRIDEEAVTDSQEYAREGELEYQLGMLEPWRKSDIGSFHIQLLDGNHRALAAIAAGERYIPVTIDPNYRQDVEEDEWL